MVSKKFAVIFSLLIVLITAGSMGAFFTVIRLRAEASQAAFSHVLEQEQRVVARRPYTGVSRSEFLALSAREAGSAELYHIGRYIPVFYNIYDPEPTERLNLHIVQVLERRGTWKYILSTYGYKWINTDWIPEEILLKVPGFNQQALGLPTGCEIVALAMLINKYVDVDVFTLVHEMPRSYNPMLGFRGDPFSGGGFTILPPALLEMTERHIGSAVDMTGASIEEVQAQLASGRPVLAWLRGMFGFTVHVIVLTGFNQYGFFYNDPWLGGISEFISYNDFLAMWEDPIIDRWFNYTFPPRIAMSY